MHTCNAMLPFHAVLVVTESAQSYSPSYIVRPLLSHPTEWGAQLARGCSCRGFDCASPQLAPTSDQVLYQQDEKFPSYYQGKAIEIGHERHGHSTHCRVHSLGV